MIYYYITIIILLMTLLYLFVSKRKMKLKTVSDGENAGEGADIYKTIFQETPFFYFLINSDVRVQLTNYFIQNPKARVPAINILGNVLSCKNACDAGKCGEGELCKHCMIRASITRAFSQKDNFKDVEASMTLYDKQGIPYDIDVSVSGSFFKQDDNQKMLICVRDITLYKSVQRRLLILEYQGNFMKRKAGIVQRLARASNEMELRDELLNILEYKGNLKEEMKSLRDAIDISSYSLLPSIEIVCHDDGVYDTISCYLNNRYQLYRGKTLEENIVIFLNHRIDAIIITADVDFNEASLFVAAIKSTKQDIPILRLLNAGESMAGEFTKIIYNPLTPSALDDELKDLQIANEMEIQ